MRHRRTVTGLVVFVAILSGCGGASDPSTSPAAPLVQDRFSVWVCHVPLDEASEMYVDSPFRLALTPANLADVLNEHVPPYFHRLSQGQYRPAFEAGREVRLDAAADPMNCVEQAVSATGDAAVLVVADAEHGGDQIGGFGHRDGDVRYAYVGASDFHPQWGDRPPIDLVAHEIGHTLGWDHSGVDGEGRYLSALDVMSNSAAARVLDPERRDASATLAINLLAAGWLPKADVWRSSEEGGDVVLAATTAASGTRLALLPLVGDHLLTVEYLVAEGLNRHLPAAGIAVHRVTMVDGEPRAATPVFGEPPFTDLLQPGDVLEAEGWRIEVGPAGQITVSPSGAKP